MSSLQVEHKMSLVSRDRPYLDTVTYPVVKVAMSTDISSHAVRDLPQTTAQVISANTTDVEIKQKAAVEKEEQLKIDSAQVSNQALKQAVRG